MAPADSSREEGVADASERPAGVGHTRWAIADGYIPGRGLGAAPALVSHEAICVLNTGARMAEVTLTIYFSDRDPVGPFRFQVEARRTKHVRFNDLTDPEPIPRDTDYACLVEASVPVVVQHTRLDSRAEALALFSTIAHHA